MATIVACGDDIAAARAKGGAAGGTSCCEVEQFVPSERLGNDAEQGGSPGPIFTDAELKIKNIKKYINI